MRGGMVAGWGLWCEGGEGFWNKTKKQQRKRRDVVVLDLPIFGLALLHHGLHA